MRWLADECVAGGLVAQLRAAGHYVDYAAETAQRASDRELLALAEPGQLVLTEDKDFGDLVFRQSRSVPGVILLRINPLRPELKWRRLQAAIEEFGDALLGRYTVVDEKRIRSRPLPTEA